MSEIRVSAEHIFSILSLSGSSFCWKMASVIISSRPNQDEGATTNHSSSSLFPCQVFCSADLGVQPSNDKLSVFVGTHRNSSS